MSSAATHSHAQTPIKSNRSREAYEKTKKRGLRESTHTWCCYIAVKSTVGRVNQKLKGEGTIWLSHCHLYRFHLLQLTMIPLL